MSSLRQADLSAFYRRDPEVTGQWQLQAAAQAEPEQGGDAGLAEVLDGIEHPQTLIEQCVRAALARSTLAELFQVHAHREVGFALGGEHQGAHLIVVREIGQDLLQRVHVVQAHAVVRRIVEADGGDRIAGRQYEWLRHAATSAPSWRACISGWVVGRAAPGSGPDPLFPEED
jgi:hypothetical protein